MSDPIILSDEEDDFSTPLAGRSKKPRSEPDPNRTVLVLDDDPTPHKPRYSSSTPSFVPETPISPLSNSDVAFVKCTRPSSSDFDSQVRASTSQPHVTGRLTELQECFEYYYVFAGVGSIIIYS